MRFGELDINPTLSPAILDTATWDHAAAWAAVEAAGVVAWEQPGASGSWPPAAGRESPLQWQAGSSARRGASLYGLVSLPDGQEVFARMGPAGEEDLLGQPIGATALRDGATLVAYPADAAVIDRFARTLRPDAGPQALGAVPRLGIGTRMTTAVWPAIWRAMRQGGFAANAIQNSVRELNLLGSLQAGLPAEQNTAFGFGTIETGYTGSTFEGLWVAGVLDALRAGGELRYGADADHVQVKRGADGLARARRLLDASRYYSFFTLDVSDVLDYAALSIPSDAESEDLLAARIPDPGELSAVLAEHRPLHRMGGYAYRPARAELGRLVGKYWAALDAVDKLWRHIAGLKDGVPFDLELSIDEHPNEIPAFDCLTSEAELCFVLLEARRRGIPLTHVAPNFGVEKGTDYRCPDGLPGLEARSRSLAQIGEEFGVMPDFHSGDDLSAATRRAIGRATGGRNHFKVSPMLQLIFGEVLADHDPELFRRWWSDAVAYAQRAAAGGSSLALECLRQDEAAGSGVPPAHGQVFHHFSFAFVGRRDAAGKFIHREEFYSLPSAFYRAYQDRIVHYLEELAGDLF